MTAPALQAVLPNGAAESPGMDGHLESSSNEIEYTNGIVKELPYLSGRGRPLRVVCIGAGAAGIYFGLKLPRTLGNRVELLIYEKNADFGGCWLENRYPGCACDIPSHVYSYSFAPNPDWTHFYSNSGEIQAYFKKVALKYGVQKHVSFETRVSAAHWNERGQWDLMVEDPNGSSKQDWCDVLINAGGILNSWKWPNIEGIETFKGPKVHSANWDDSIRFDNQATIGVIGNGSSAIQIVPSLQPIVKSLSTFIRTKTWIALPFTSGKVKEKAAQKGVDGIDALVDPETSNPPYSEEERQQFRENPDCLNQYRKEIEHENNTRFALSTRKDSPAAKQAIPVLTDIMKSRLAGKPELADVLIPEWNVGCRRLTPGVGYLEALCEPNVEVVTTGIDRIVEEGILTKDGKVHKMDVLVCATGFDVSNRPHFDARGRNGHVFTDEWAKSPKGYMTVAMEQMPNYFVFNGPNAPLANGSLLPAMEAAGDYIIKVIDKLEREDIRSICVKTEAIEQFCAYSDAWMPRSIWSAGCRSWYKGGTTDGRVSGVWPGSILHYMQTLAHPRFEDYDYTYLNRKNPFTFLGNGLTKADVDPNADRAPYLDGREIVV